MVDRDSGLTRRAEDMEADPARLLAQLYAELRAAAQRQMNAERADHTLSATALVHEAYLKLAGTRDQPLANRAHFHAAAVEAMRRVLLDHAKARARQKRGGRGPAGGGSLEGGVEPASTRSNAESVGPVSRRSVNEDLTVESPGPCRPGGAPVVAPAFQPVRRLTLDAAAAVLAENSDPAEFLALDEAICRLKGADARSAEVVRLRYYAGLSVEEAAAVLGVSPRTVKNDWAFAKAWLARELK